jgi:hypothetical protein
VWLTSHFRRAEVSLQTLANSSTVSLTTEMHASRFHHRRETVRSSNNRKMADFDAASLPISN